MTTKREIEEYALFEHNMFECYPKWDFRATKKIWKIAKSLHHQYENQCNYELSKWQEGRIRNLEEEVEKMSQEYEFKYHTTSDPRGYPIKIHLTNGNYNTMGGRETGWGIAY